jgi:RNA polymerase sigma-70 factor, ECF subfamily
MVPHLPLASAFLGSFAGQLPHDLPALEAQLTAALQGARDVWSGIDVDAETFAAYLGQRAVAEQPASVALSQVQSVDLYLACACAMRDQRAILEFERRFLSQVATYVQRLDRSPAFADDVRQHLAEDLLVGRSEAGPGLARYSGRGPLSAFVRLASVRTARYLMRVRRRHVPMGPMAEAPGSTDDLELELLKRQYAAEFHEAFAAAIAALSPEIRAALKMHFLDGMTMDAIAAMYRVNKSTVSRWITRARHQLFAEARQALAERLDMPAAEIDSLVQLLQSRIQVTLRWFLDEPGGGR